MVKYKNVLPAFIVRGLKIGAVKNTEHKKHKICPGMAEPIYKIPPPDLTKKGGTHHQREDQQQEGGKGQKGINGIKYLYGSF